MPTKWEVIPISNRDGWNTTVRSMNGFDFYHLAEYHLLENEGEALLLSYTHDTDSVCLPVVLRPIAGTDYTDVTSVYGYVGPLTNTPSAPAVLIAEFQSFLKQFFDERKVVSAFSRMHPLFEANEQLLTGLGEIKERNQTVAIDLSLPENEQKKQYARSLKYAINRLKRDGFTVREGTTTTDIDAFIAVYYENMSRVNASPYYYFPKEYFYRLLASIDSALIVVEQEGEIVSGTVCTMCGDIMQAHLNATTDKSLERSPLKLALEYARELANSKGLNYLHLGGGLGGNDDSLFVFKSRFSHRRFIFKTWQYIHNSLVYDRLSENSSKRAKSLFYFPLYRS